MMAKKLFLTVIVLTLVGMVVSCGSKEEKKLKFYNKGQALYEQEDYVKARLELKNALQIDPKYGDAYYLLGMVELKDKNPKKAFGYLRKSVELNPELTMAHLELGRLFLAGRALDRAREKAELVLGKEPQNQEGRLLMASILVAEKKADKAEQMLTALKDEGFSKENLYLLLAALRTTQKDIDGAILLINEGIQNNRQSIPLHMFLVRLYRAADNKEKSIDTMQKIIGMEPEKIEHRLVLAGMYRNEGMDNDSEQLLADLESKYADDEEKLIAITRFYLRQKEVEKAAGVLTTGLETNPKAFKLRKALSELEMRANQPDKALAILEAGLNMEKDPAHPGILLTKTSLARIHLAKRELSPAEAFIDEVLAESGAGVDAHQIKGELHLLRGKGAEAVSEFRSVLRERPNTETSYLQLAEAHAMNSEMDLAVDTIQQGLKLMPESKPLLLSLAKGYIYTKDYDAAEEKLLKLVEVDPEDARSRATLGDLYLDLKKLPQAREQYGAIIANTPKVPAGYMKMARYYLVQKKPDKALAVLQQGYQSNNNSATLLTDLVRLHISQKQYNAAARLCKDRLKINSKEAFTHNLLGKIYATQKDWIKAEASYQKAIAIQPDWQETNNNLAGMYLAQGKKEAAVSKFENALKDNSKNPSAYLALGALYELDKKHDRAIKIYEQALAHIPDFWTAANNLAFLLSEYKTSIDDLNRALELAQKANELKPGRPTVMDTLAWVHFKQGNLERSLGMFEKLLLEDPDNPIFNFHTGMVLEKMGKIEDAKKRLEAALSTEQRFYGREQAEEALARLKAG